LESRFIWGIAKVQVYRNKITGTTPMMTAHPPLGTQCALLVLDGDGDVPVPLLDGAVDVGAIVVAVLVPEGPWLNTLAKTAGG